MLYPRTSRHTVGRQLGRGIAVFMLLLCLQSPPTALAEQIRDADSYHQAAKQQVASGNLGQAAAILEAGAAHVGDEAAAFYKQAGWLREQRGEIGQALLDYRAMLRSSTGESVHIDFAHHLAYLSLLIDHNRQLPGLPLRKELQLEVSFPLWFERQKTTAEPRAETDSSPGLPVPGGLPLLARTVGIDLPLLNGPDGVERLVSYILGAAPGTSDKLEDNAVRRDIALYVRDYADLRRHLETENLLPSNFDPQKEPELVFPLLQSGIDQERTRKLLLFFGIEYKIKTDKSSGQAAVELKVRDGKTATERQHLLRNMGAPMPADNLRDVRVPLMTDYLPMLAGADFWKRALPDKGGSRLLLERLIENAGALRLYLALAQCSENSRRALVDLVPANVLLKSNDSMLSFGPALDFRDGHLWLPGSSSGWEQLLQTPTSDAGRFLTAMIQKDNGKALMLYGALAQAAPSIQSYVTSPPERMARIYGMLLSVDPGPVVPGALPFKPDFARILRQMDVNPGGLRLDLDHRLAQILVREAAPGRRSEVRSVEPELNDLSNLLRPAIPNHAPWGFSPLDIVEFLRYVERTRPGLLSDAVVSALIAKPQESPAFMDLIWDINPDAGLAARYLQYCSKLAEVRHRDWNVNRTRSSEAVFFLISALRRQGTLSHEQANGLLADLLSGLDATDEAQFASALAAFLANRLLPEISKSVGDKGNEDMVLSGLAGPGGPSVFDLEAKQLQLDLPAFRLRRMQETIRQQSYTPLSVLLEIYQLLAPIQSAGDASAQLKSLEEKFSRVQSARFAPGNSKVLRDSVAHVDIPNIRQRLQTAGSSRANLSKLAGEIQALMHVELGVTLLTYCYAFSGAPEIDVLSFDPNFVRKHRFYGPGASLVTGWIPASTTQREELGTFLDGSISGLGYQLARLQSAQTVQDFGKEGDRDLVPTLLFSMRAIHPELVSDRAQEFVALAVRLGRELVALSGLDENAKKWMDRFFAPLLSPQRHEEADRSITSLNPIRALEILSPSELFVLGRSYFESTGGRGLKAAIFCPILDRMQAIIPTGGSDDVQRFHREVDQYGTLLRRRLGLSQLSLDRLDSYEGLERSMRTDILYERICDLKIRLAELNYSLGLPARIGELESELALRDVLPRSQTVRASSWRAAIEQIYRIRVANVRAWIDELVDRGLITPTNNVSGGASSP